MTVSGYIDRLAARGLVRRRIDPDDGRAKLVELTAAAQAVLAEVQVIAAGIRADAARSIPRRDWDQLIETLRAARVNLAGLRSGDRASNAA
jgi:DNA-binding MarR family transcriptional regulator